MLKDEVRNSFYINLVISILTTIFGIWLLYKPYATITFISMFIAMILMVVVGFSIYKYFTRSDKKKKFDFSIIYGLISLIIALFLFIKPTFIKEGIQEVISIIMILYLFSKYTYTMIMYKSKDKNINVCIFIISIMLILSLILLFNSVKTVFMMNQILGSFICFYSILNIILSFIFYNNIK